MIVIARFFGWLFSWVALGALFGLGAFLAVISYFSHGLPSIDDLQTYAPPTISRVYDGEGVVLDEFATEKRIYTPADEIPDLVKNAFISAEDKNFYTHAGYDPIGMLSAIRDSLQGNTRGASTIPQQVAKNFKLSGEQSAERKIREIIIANRMVETLPRDHILALYMNEIFLGQNSYGVTAAARTYFNKTLEELSIEEVAYLAAIPRAPSNFHPVDNYERAKTARDNVIREMFENGYITKDEADQAQATDLITVQSGDIPSPAETRPPRDYFTDEIRRQLEAELGKEALFEEGLSVRATIDRDLQEKARQALRDALEKYDRNLGLYNGAVAKIPAEDMEQGWEVAIDNLTAPRDITGWSLAVVLDAAGEDLRIGIEGAGEASLPLSDFNWARYLDENERRQSANAPSDMFARGDVLYVKPKEEGGYTFRQVPEVSGAFAAIDPRNGRVIALVGGFSYETSNLNRATQAYRQPGSAFKPFVYAAALDAGYLPNAVIVDAPIEINTPQGVWRPQNASNRYYGPTPMMTGLEQSRNLMTIRLAQDVGMDIVADYGERYGVYDDLQPVLANALGAQETTLYRLIAAYSTFANGGKEITPTVVDRVQDRYGKTIIAQDKRDCIPCVGADASPDVIPEVRLNQRQVMDPITSFQIMTMLRSAVANGTGRSSVGKLGLPISGKTGTTNDAKDVWFVGFTPKIVAGCYIGYDDPKPLGRGAAGGTICGPVFANFIQEALKTYGGFDYPVPEGGSLVKLDRISGVRLGDGASGSNVITMLFRDIRAPGVGEGGILIDGGFAMGSDLQLIAPGEEGSVTEVEVNVGGETKALPSNPTVGTISTGGLY